MWKSELLKKRKRIAFDKAKAQIIAQSAEHWDKIYEDFLKSQRQDKTL
jgi:hypothetical protein